MGRLHAVREQVRICDTCGQPIDSEGAHTTFTPTKHGIEVSWTCVYCIGAEIGEDAADPLDNEGSTAGPAPGDGG